MTSIFQQLVELLNDKNIHINELQSCISQFNTSKDKKLWLYKARKELWGLFYQHAYPLLIQNIQGQFINLLWCIYLDESDLSQQILQSNSAQLLIESERFKLTPLYIAAFKGNIPISKQLLNTGFNSNTATIEGGTPLHIAAHNGDLELAQLLFDKGANGSVAANNGHTPLHVAAQNGHLELAKLFFDKGVNGNVATNNGHTPLHVAAQNGHLELVKLLLDKGANVNTADKDGFTSLHVAAQNGNLELTQLLLDKGVNANAEANNGFTSLHLATQKGHLEPAQLLLNNAANANAAADEDCTPLHLAAQYSHLELAKLLLDKGADANAATNKGYSPLHLAAQKGHLELTQLLLDKGANVNAEANDGFTPLHLAAQKGHLELTQLLLNNAAYVKAAKNGGITPLHLAAQNGQLELAQLLLDKGANANAATNKGYSPLHLATQNGHLKLAQRLLNNGADIRAALPKGNTLLHLAAHQGHLELVQLLLNNGVYIDPLSVAGETPLQSAVGEKHLDIINYLILKGADVEITCHPEFPKKTLLHWAIFHGHLDTVQLLINREANINAPKGWRSRCPPIVYAIEYKHTELIKFFLDRNATLLFKQIGSRISPELMMALEHNTTLTKIPGQTSKKYGTQLSKIAKRNKAIITSTKTIVTEIRNITELHILDLAARQHNLLFIEQEMAAIALLAPHASQLHELNKQLITAYCFADNPQSAWQISQKLPPAEITQEQWQLIALGLHTQLTQHPDNKECAHQVLTCLNHFDSIDGPMSSPMIQSMAYRLHQQGQALPAQDLTMSQLWQQHTQEVWQIMLNNYPQLVIHCMQQLITERQNQPQRNTPFFSLTLPDENQHLQARFSICVEQLAQVIEQSCQYSRKRRENPQQKHELDNLAPPQKRPCTQNNNHPFFAPHNPKELEQEHNVSGFRPPSN